MDSIKFPQCNTNYGPPDGMAESQVRTIPAYRGTIQTGHLEGANFVVVAFQPNEVEKAAIAAGAPIYLNMLGGLAPHLLATSFEEVTNV